MNKNHSNLLAALVALTLCDAPVLARGMCARSKSSQTRQRVQTVKSKAAAQPRKKSWTAEERAQKEEEVVDIICDILQNAWGEVDRGDVKDLVNRQNNTRLGQMWDLDPWARLQVPTGYARDDRKYVNDVNKQISGVLVQGNRLFQPSQPVKGKKGPILTPYQKVAGMMDFCTSYPAMYGIHQKKFDILMQKAIQGVRNPNQRAELMDEWNNVKENINSEDRYDEGVYAVLNDAASNLDEVAYAAPSYAEPKPDEGVYAAPNPINSEDRYNDALLGKLLRTGKYDRVSKKNLQKLVNDINDLYKRFGRGKKYHNIEKDLGAVSENKRDYLMSRGTFSDLVDEINELQDEINELQDGSGGGYSRKTRYGKFETRETRADEEWDREWKKKRSRSTQRNDYSDDSGQDKNQSSSDFNASSKPRLAIKQDFDFEDTTLDMAFDALGLSQGATQDEVKKAFRKLSLEHHPDKGGDKEKFQKISVANKKLNDHFNNIL